MQDIKQWEDKIKQKRMNTQWREFIKQRCSWKSLTFYKNKGKISQYPISDRIINLASSESFESVRNNNVSLESNGSFFQNISKLFTLASQRNVIHFTKNENSEYSNGVHSGKNIYLSSSVYAECENILYSFEVRYNAKDILNSFFVFKSSLVYDSFSISDSHKIFYSKGVNNSANIRFSSNLVGCQECINCHDLDNTSYYIDNQEYSKSEYFKKKEHYLKNKSNYSQWGKEVFLKLIKNVSAIKSSGVGLLNCENIDNGFLVNHLDGGRNIILGGSKFGTS